MKRIIFLLILSAFLTPLFSEPIKYVNPELKIKEITPSNPKSGEVIKISFILYNNGNDFGNFSVKFLNNSVFKFITFDNDNFLVNPYSFIEFNAFFRVNEVKSGKYPLVAKVSYNKINKYFTFYVKVINNPILNLIQDTKICVLNKECNFSFYVSNLGFGNAKNVVFNFNLPSEDVILNKIKANSTQKINTKIFVPQNLKEGVFNLKVEASYLDENNNLVKKTFLLPIEIKSNVNLQISSLEYNNGYLKIKIENSGYGTAKNIIAKIYLDNLSRTFFLGSLNEGEDSTIYFYLPKNVYGEKEVKIKLYWTDYKNKSENFTAKIYIPKKEESHPWVFAFILILIIFAAFFGFKKLKSEKNEK